MEAESSASEAKSKVPYEYTQGPYWGGPSLSYLAYAILAVFPITGLLGLDHLYLRSPRTALSKFGLNIITFGLWYFYDVLHAIFDGDNTRKFGLETPFSGPAGIGAGMFLEGDQEAAAGTPGAWTFLAYATCVLFVPFGVEYLVAGDTWGFIGKLISYITVIVPAYVWIRQIFSLCSDPTELFKCGAKRYVPFMKPNPPTNPFGAGGTICAEPEPEGGQGFFARLWEKINVFKKVWEFILNMPLIGRVLGLATTVLEILGIIRKTATDTVEGVAKVGAAAAHTASAVQGVAGKIQSAVGSSDTVRNLLEKESGFAQDSKSPKKKEDGTINVLGSTLDNLREAYSVNKLEGSSAASEGSK